MIVEVNRLGGLYGKHQMGSVYDKNKLCPTIDTMNSGNRQPMIIEDFYSSRTPRTYQELAPILRSDREGLKVVETKYKGMLIDESTKSVAIIEEVNQIGNMVDTGNWDNPQRGRIYSTNGCCPALNTVGGGGLEPKIMTMGNYTESNHDASRVVDTNGLAPTVKENHGTVTGILDNFDEPKIVASRGRNPENPSDRTSGIHTEQRLEVNSNGLSNTITTVQKDNFVIKNYRIRKLTPRECGRLMGVSDEDITKMLEVNSNSQCYKQFGNSIVVDVMEAMFRNLNMKGVPND